MFDLILIYLLGHGRLAKLRPFLYDGSYDTHNALEYLLC